MAHARVHRLLLLRVVWGSLLLLFSSLNISDGSVSLIWCSYWWKTWSLPVVHIAFCAVYTWSCLWNFDSCTWGFAPVLQHKTFQCVEVKALRHRLASAFVLYHFHRFCIWFHCALLDVLFFLVSAFWPLPFPLVEVDISLSLIPAKRDIYCV